MTKVSLARSGHETNGRIDRGRELFEEHSGEIRFADGVWLIPSQNGGTSVYEVRLGLHPSCECRDFEYRGHRGECKHIRCARIAEAASADPDLRIDYPLEEELLAACEHALIWFEAWEEHADHEHDFGGEHAVMKKLRRACQLARQGF